jgi:signal transduction histidine kinase
MMLDSGARGSKEQIRQLCGMRGLMAKPQKSGASGQEIIGKTDFDLPWGLEFAKKCRANDLHIMNTSLSEECEETAILQGKKATFLSLKTPLKNKEKEIIGILGLSIDITKQKEAEKALLEAKKEAEAASQAKTEFLKNMHHDLRTPVAAMICCAEMLKVVDSMEEVRDFAQRLSDSGHELLRFLIEVLDSVRATSGHMPIVNKTFDLQETMHNLIKLHQPIAIKQKLDLILFVDPSIPQNVVGDPTRIYRLLLELLVNALKFTVQGTVAVTVMLVKKENRDLVLKFSIKDTGPGIPRHQQEEIFIRFKKLIPSHEATFMGSGLGLALVKQFLEDLEGEIFLKSPISEAIQGSEFTCFIPMKESLLENIPMEMV